MKLSLLQTLTTEADNDKDDAFTPPSDSTFDDTNNNREYQMSNSEEVYDPSEEDDLDASVTTSIDVTATITFAHDADFSEMFKEIIEHSQFKKVFDEHLAKAVKNSFNEVGQGGKLGGERWYDEFETVKSKLKADSVTDA